MSFLTHLKQLSEENVMLILAVTLFILCQQKGKAAQAIAALEQIEAEA